MSRGSCWDELYWAWTWVWITLCFPGCDRSTSLWPFPNWTSFSAPASWYTTALTWRSGSRSTPACWYTTFPQWGSGSCPWVRLWSWRLMLSWRTGLFGRSSGFPYLFCSRCTRLFILFRITTVKQIKQIKKIKHIRLGTCFTPHTIYEKNGWYCFRLHPQNETCWVGLPFTLCWDNQAKPARWICEVKPTWR